MTARTVCVCVSVCLGLLVGHQRERRVIDYAGWLVGWLVGTGRKRTYSGGLRRIVSVSPLTAAPAARNTPF